jgi:SSS family solute:Na+ symporter
VGVGIIDILVFVIFVVAVIGIGLWQSRGEKTHSEHGAKDYFLAGRGLTWWLVGFSLIAANISTEQFVGMSGKAADWLGMAIASYEWMAAITLVVVAFLWWSLPSSSFPPSLKAASTPSQSFSSTATTHLPEW